MIPVYEKEQAQIAFLPLRHPPIGHCTAERGQVLLMGRDCSCRMTDGVDRTHYRVL
jgi:hypothetical protein